MESQDLRAFCGLPPADWMSASDGLVDNREYVDMRDWNDIESFEEMWEFEKKALRYRGDLDSDEAMERFEEEEFYWVGLDPLIGSTVFALVLAGAVPFSSCCGRPGHAETEPLVAFWCPEDILPRIERAASKTGACLRGTSGEHPGIVVHHESDIAVLRRFARALVRSLPQD